ncbi:MULTISPECIES: lipase [unclassified Enterococcus]|uniref:lipase n=1 Tax=unclassified Enterococcus TaxID=2608891 RepID=UPI0013EAF713|nr:MULTISPECIES: lipase [unclassified Enterococcus]
MIVDEQYSVISEAVYWLDPKHKYYDPTYKENSIKKIGSYNFKILKIKENSSSNGMQAMAVAPIIHGKVDISQVVIAFAGTNQADLKDLETDVRSVMNLYGNRPFSSDLEKRMANTLLHVTGLKTAGQVDAAAAFAEEVQKKYSQATISTTGHSLGEFLALYVASENQWKNVGFNGPDPYELLSPEAKKWVEENPGMLTNYRNRADFIGNFGGNGTGAEIKIGMNMGFQNPLAYHSLSGWTFDQEGQLIVPDHEANALARQKQQEAQAMSLFTAGISELEILRRTFTASGGQLSSNEKIYLEDTQALLVAENLSQTMKRAMERVIRINQDGIEALEENWREGLKRARYVAPALNEQELLEALASVGATRENLVDSPKEMYQLRIDKAKKMGESFDGLIQEIKAKIHEIVDRDRELARQLR